MTRTMMMARTMTRTSDSGNHDDGDNDCNGALVCHVDSGLCKCTSDVVWQARMSWSCPDPAPTTPTTTIAPVTGPCTIDEHCSGVGTCDTDPGVCVCLHDLISIDNEWVCTTACSGDSDCQSLNPASICNSNGQCVDSSDPINTPDPFIRDPDYDGTCTSDNDCLDMNTCVNGECVCQETLLAVDGVLRVVASNSEAPWHWRPVAGG